MPRSALLTATALLTLAACGGDERDVVVTEDEVLVAEDVPEDVVTPLIEADAPAGPAVPLTLTALDCGRIEVGDLDLFDVGGAYAGESDTYADTCWVIEHEDGVLLWDLGVPAALTQMGPIENGPFRISLARTLADQLEERGIVPDFVAISHHHFDHTGQPEVAPDAVFLVTEAERAFMQENPAQEGATPFDALLALKTDAFSGERDVFGDGRVRIIEMPGHTPGHAVLLVDLEEEGPVLLSGDLYHLDRARSLRTVPRFNWNEEATRESMDRIEALAAETNARVVIQHENADVADLIGRPLR